MGAAHGGAFWDEVGGDLSRLAQVVRADVLDAWFPPAPEVLDSLRRRLPEICSTSPQVSAEPLRSAIAKARGVAPESILVGAGSSDLIYGALPRLASTAASALVLDPTYGEYRHVLEKQGRVGIQTITLSPSDGFALDQSRLLEPAADLVLLVNPNSPTGHHVPAQRLAPVVRELSRQAVVWIDETYIEYAGSDQSLERLAASDPNVIVCKSMSKVYALSGLRIGYLVSHPDRIRELEQGRRPWAVSLPAQMAGEVALSCGDYYRQKVVETAILRMELSGALRALGLEVFEGSINCVLCQTSAAGLTASQLCTTCRQAGVYLRDAASMGSTMERDWVRIAVRSAGENARIAEAIEMALADSKTAASLQPPA